ncbi:MAG TPA: hypothetical protein VE860_27010 [Chthoniobacterales bacterium]|nr:hypothetical protein [Chthoniobacterales bacterium]
MSDVKERQTEAGMDLIWEDIRERAGARKGSFYYLEMTSQI